MDFAEWKENEWLPHLYDSARLHTEIKSLYRIVAALFALDVAWLGVIGGVLVI